MIFIISLYILTSCFKILNYRKFLVCQIQTKNTLSTMILENKDNICFK